MSVKLEQQELHLSHSLKAYQRIVTLIQEAHQDSIRLDKFERQLSKIQYDWTSSSVNCLPR